MISHWSSRVEIRQSNGSQIEITEFPGYLPKTTVTVAYERSLWLDCVRVIPSS